MTKPEAYQFALSVYTPMLTGNLSVLGSSLIVCSILFHGRRNKLKRPHHRMLLVMSCFDVIFSLAKGWGFLLIPKGYGTPGAQGNMTTCSLLGACIQIGYGAGAYNSALCLYYYLTVCHGMNARKWSRIEPYVHAFIITLFAGLIITAVVLDLFKPNFGSCSIVPFPPGCESRPGAPPCEKYSPRQIGILHELLSQLWIQISLVIVLFTNISIFLKVRQQQRRNKKYQLKSKSSDVGSATATPVSTIENTTISDNTNNNNNNDNDNEDKKIPVVSADSTTVKMLSTLLSNDSSSRSRSGRFAAVCEYSWRVLMFRSSSRSFNQNQKEKRLDREKMIAEQCFLYSGAFVLCWIGPIVFHLVAWFAGYKAFWAMMVISIFTPLQGCFNAIIYARPQVIRLRQKYPEITYGEIISRIFFSEDPFSQQSEIRDETDQS